MLVGVLGAGRMGTLHAGILHDHPGVDGIVVFDPVEERARALAGAHDASVASSQDDLLRRCAAVVIASSTDAHAPDLVAAARAGVPALCEKPIAPDVATADEVVDQVESTGTPAQIGFNRRFDPGFRAAHAAVRSGALGELLTVSGQHHDHRPPPAAYIPVSGGQFKDQLIHDFDLLRYVTDEEVVRVHAATTSQALGVFAEHGDSVVAVITLWLAGGTVATLTGVRTDPIGYDVRMELYGTNDSIAVGVDERTPLRSVEPGQKAPSDPYRDWLPRFGASYEAQADAFLGLAGGTAGDGAGVRDGRAALAIAEACERSVASGGPVDVEMN